MKLTSHIYRSDAEKRRDFIIGFVGCIVLNIALAIPFGLSTYWLGQIPLRQGNLQAFASTLSVCFGLLPWVINPGAIIYFAATRSQIALGAITALGIVLALAFCLVVIAGAVFLTTCF